MFSFRGLRRRHQTYRHNPNSVVLRAFFFTPSTFSSFWTRRGHRFRPFSTPVLAFNFYRVQGSATPLLDDFSSMESVAKNSSRSLAFRMLFCAQEKSQRIYTRMHSMGLELTKLTSTRLEGNLIRDRGDRYIVVWPRIGTPKTSSRYRLNVDKM